MPESDLERLVYLSSAVRKINSEDLAHIVFTARRRNILHNITGALLYSNGMFIQCLEGASEDVRKIYQIIKQDRRHEAVTTLIQEPIAEREFNDWGLAYKARGVEGYPVELAGDYLFDGDRLTVEENPSSSLFLLNRFWLSEGFTK